jgi:hypothetical protein
LLDTAAASKWRGDTSVYMEMGSFPRTQYVASTEGLVFVSNGSPVLEKKSQPGRLLVSCWVDGNAGDAKIGVPLPIVQDSADIRRGVRPYDRRLVSVFLTRDLTGGLQWREWWSAVDDTLFSDPMAGDGASLLAYMRTAKYLLVAFQTVPDGDTVSTLFRVDGFAAVDQVMHRRCHNLGQFQRQPANVLYKMGERLTAESDSEFFSMDFDDWSDSTRTQGASSMTRLESEAIVRGVATSDPKGFDTYARLALTCRADSSWLRPSLSIGVPLRRYSSGGHVRVQFGAALPGRDEMTWTDIWNVVGDSTLEMPHGTPKADSAAMTFLGILRLAIAIDVSIRSAPVHGQPEMEFLVEGLEAHDARIAGECPRVPKFILPEALKPLESRP